MKILKTTSCVVFAFALSLSALAQTKPVSKTGVKPDQLLQALTLDSAVRYGKLPNGFTYYIRHNDKPKDRVLLYLVNKVGSILEDEDQRGLAHFMEHMSFNGTKHFPHNELEDYLQKAGVRFGADLNAFTSFNETVYQLPIPSNKPDVLNSGIQIIRDWAHGALLDPEEIDKERGIVLEEERKGKGAAERLRRDYMPLLLNNSRYANRLPIGLESVLKNFKYPTLARFYNDWYRPDLQAIIVVGDINVAAIEKAIRTKFSDLKNPVNKKPRTEYGIPLTGKNQYIALTDTEQTGTNIQILYKQPKLQVKTSADYRAYMTRQLFNKMLNDRFAAQGTMANPPYLGCSAGIGGFFGVLDAFTVNISPKPGQLQKGLEAALEELNRLKKFGFTQSELDRAKTSRLRAMENSLKEKDKTSSITYVQDYQSNFLDNTASPSIEKEFELTSRFLKEISLAEVNLLPSKYITETNRDILVLAPASAKKSLPSEQTVNNWISQANQKQVTAYEDKPIEQQLLARELVPGKIVDEKEDATLGITTLTLSNGVKVVLKPTTFKNDEILFSSFSKGGASLYEDADYQSAVNAVAVITSGGAGKLDLTALRRFLSGKNVAVQPYISDLYQGVSGRTNKSDLETCLKLLDAYLTEPRKDETVFNNIITRSNANLANRGNDPNSVFQDTTLAVLYNNNFRKTSPSLAKLKQIDLDRSFAIYKERLGSVDGATFVFTGSFTVDQMKPLLEKYIASLPSTNNTINFKDRNIKTAEGVIEKNIYKGKEAVATVNLIFSGKYTFDRQTNMELQALKEVLQIRVLQRLREEESGVYSPQVAVGNSKYPTATYMIQIGFSCAPENVDRLIAAAKDEIQKTKTAGPTQVDVDKWKAEYSSQMETQQSENSYWLAYLNGSYQNDMEPLPPSSYKQRMDKVTVSSLKTAANQYLSGANYIRMALLPEKSK